MVSATRTQRPLPDSEPMRAHDPERTLASPFVDPERGVGARRKTAPRETGRIPGFLKEYMIIVVFMPSELGVEQAVEAVHTSQKVAQS